MNDEIKSFLLAMGSIILMGFFIVLIVSIFGWYGDREEKEQYEKGYIDACKDFYKGKLKYDLVDNGDGTIEWKKITK